MRRVVLLASVIMAVCLSSPLQTTAAENAPYAAGKAKKKQRVIAKVEPVNVDSPVGCVPRLPWQVWVTYSDGYKEWRQIRWSNSNPQMEKDEADATKYPVGKQYSINGVIIGDNTTTDGYPIVANVTVTDKTWNVPSNTPIAKPLPLSAVKITGDNRLTSNRNLDVEEILKWDVAQQLYNYRDTYGLPTDGYPESDGWDSPTTKLKGHGSGHYMSALAFAYSSVQDANLKGKLLERIERMVNELRECQERTHVWNDSLGRYWEARDLAPEEELVTLKGTWAAFNEYKKGYKKYGYGYINAIPAQHPALIECYRAYNNEDWVWAPYYSIHKQLAGLIDITNAVRNDHPQIADKAQLIATEMGLWVWNRLHYRTYVKTDGDRQARQARPGNRYEMWNMYIAGEVGGMAESLSRLSEMSNDKTEKAHLLEAANMFDAPAFYEPVSKNIDDIRTRHANQHIPMITGALRSYIGNANPYYYNLAVNFWNMIQGRYVYAMGGVGNGEMFRQPYSQMLSMNTSVMQGWGRRGGMLPNPDMNETCCAYNLAKLTKDLNCFDPDNAEYMDYYERVLFNQIIGSVHPTEYATTYQYAVGMNAIKPFGNETPQSSCCGGTGAENHVKYQEAAYFVTDNTIYVGLYMPTEAVWEEKHAVIRQECLWPSEKSTFTVSAENGQQMQNFAIKFRVPYWATEGFDVRLNGKSVSKNYQPCSYVEIPVREWSTEDVVEVIMPFTKHINFGPDKMELAATPENSRQPFDPQWVGTLMYGPLVMTTPDVKDWSEADFTLNSNLSDITANVPTTGSGYDGNLYTLELAGKKFVPDYYETEHSTHYLRLNVQTDSKAKVKSGKTDFTALRQALSVAKERKAAQEAWNAMTEKVPVHSPWAPYGYARLLDAMQKAEAVAENTKATQVEVNSALASLNVVVNTMRPGNLAEPEDLNELLPLLTEYKDIRNKTTELREAITYADMVVGYVNDGSGTKDFIEKAIAQLKEAHKTLRPLGFDNRVKKEE